MAYINNPNQSGPRSARLPVNSTNTRLTVTVSAASANYELVLADANTAATFDGTFDIEVPENATVNFPTGTQVVVINRGTGTLTIAPQGGVTINSAGGLYDITAEYGVASLIKTGTDEWYLAGNLA
jgi:hypothetical protein